MTKAHALPAVATDNFLSLKKEGRRLLLQGDYVQSQETLAKALALEPEAADIFYLLGRCAHAREQIQLAIDYYNKSLALSENVDVYNALIDVFISVGQSKEVLKICDIIEKKKITNYDTLNRKGIGYLLNSDVVGAVTVLMKAVEIEPQYPDARILMNDAVHHGVPNFNRLFKSALQLCLQSEDMQHVYLASGWFQQIKEDPEAAPLRQMIQSETYDDFLLLYARPENRSYVLSPFFRLGIEKLVISTPDFERFLSHLRRYYLEVIYSEDELSHEEKTLLSAIAINCFLTEFCMDETPEESALLAELQTEIESKNFHPDNISIFAAYRILSTLKNVDEIVRSGALRRSDAGRLIAYHIEEPRIENELKKTIQHLVHIKDKVSRAVQEQYEENPYPRWLHSHRMGPLGERHRQNHKLKMLIAGCGTGKQVVFMASTLPQADILAMDLSSASLAYGMRKIREYNIDNVTFRQGDILNLAEALEPESFDRVECTGVLHHMNDPMAGWRVLTKLMKPGASMTMGLYSEFARRDIVEARAMVAEKGFPSTLEGIRACRAYIKSLPKDSPLHKLTQRRDFYTVSEFRDLILHVQEHRFTLLQIRDCLKELGLEFHGFMTLSPARLGYFKEKNPEQNAHLDLEKWHVFEEEYPNFFSSMYQFKCYKPLK